MKVRVALLALAVATSAQAQAPTTTTTPTTTATTTADAVQPEVLDISIAADNPLAAPVLQLTVKDNVGVASVVAHWRVEGSPWQETPFVGGGPMYMARLPDGPQKVGFGVWIEAKDAAGNVARVGSEAAPLEVAAAVEGNNDRVARQAAADAAFRGPHPAWVMLALGSGIAAGAGAGVFVYDLNVLGHKRELVNDLLDSNDLSDKRRAELEATGTAIDKAVLQDQALVGTLGVLAGAALATGVVLLTVSAIEQ